MRAGIRGQANVPGSVSALEAWTMYAYLAVFAYTLYAIGNLTPYLRDDLQLTDSTAGLHATALAMGTLLAGIGMDVVARRFGSRRTLAVAVWGGALAPLVVGLAPVLAVSLFGALLAGLAGGSLGANVNLTLGRSGGAESRKLLARANAWAMATAAVAPFLIAGAAVALHFWRLALVVPCLALVVVTVLGSPGPGTAPGASRHADPRLGRSFWIAWLFIVVAVAIEFSFVVWGSTLVAAKTGVARETATVAAGVFVAGMLCGRLALTTPRAAELNPRVVLLAGLAVVALGAIVTWLATDAWVSAGGTYLGGLGTSALYPIGVAVAMRAGRGSELAAGVRLTLATGIALLVAPSLLGVLSDRIGVVASWPIVLAFAAIGLLVAVASTRGIAGEEVSPAIDALDVGFVEPVPGQATSTGSAAASKSPGTER